LKNLPAIEDAEQAGLRKIAVYFLRNTMDTAESIFLSLNFENQSTFK
jgi:hypothetical protein